MKYLIILVALCPHLIVRVPDKESRSTALHSSGLPRYKTSKTTKSQSTKFHPLISLSNRPLDVEGLVELDSALKFIKESWLLLLSILSYKRVKKFSHQIYSVSMIRERGHLPRTIQKTARLPPMAQLIMRLKTTVQATSAARDMLYSASSPPPSSSNSPSKMDPAR